MDEDQEYDCSGSSESSLTPIPMDIEEDQNRQPEASTIKQKADRSTFEAGTQCLQAISNTVSSLENRVKEDVRADWVLKLERLQDWEERLVSLSEKEARNVIALYGETGAGKSTLINAILEDEIVPTSCTNACTAVATEISYKEGPGITAEIKYLSKEEWKVELEALIDDIRQDPEDIVANTSASTQDSPSQIAWSKVQAVYPSIARNDLKTLDAESILRKYEAITTKLGTSDYIQAADAEEFAIKRRHTLESGDFEENEVAANSPQHWPLIKLAKIRCNAEPLSKGTVLVDLPGTGDANAARNAIAANYLKNCHSVWIVAQASRACDNARAKECLRNALQTQFAMDGRIGDDDLQIRIAFIATKCDETTAAEIAKSLHLQADATFKYLQNEHKNPTTRGSPTSRFSVNTSASSSKRSRSRSPFDTSQSPMKRRRDGEEYLETDDPLRSLREYCSKKYSQQIKSQLQDSFRSFLQEEGLIDPNQANRVSLPVYTCTAGDYNRLKRPDFLAEPHYFRTGDDLKATGIKALQDLCKSLADATEKQELISFLRRIHELATVIDMHLNAYIQQDAALADFRKMWKERTNRTALFSRYPV
ncbi:hypothetical protein SCHPADRAFT_444039 [Schizopora paradoxa]|uniref:Dynamin N-terminal domain-containing protein n=1 Tax=Schizopora paradoxa TaxID=27342 RepID=A0A0H2RK46_9AGAM|nr:hypothetical protein SCHPADRAFT_444039 [Schizopora paradoxa]